VPVRSGHHFTPRPLSSRCDLQMLDSASLLASRPGDIGQLTDVVDVCVLPCSAARRPSQSPPRAPADARDVPCGPGK
jgi:hypothetical protein